MICVKCGKELEEGTAFCPSCGTKVESNNSSSSTDSMSEGNMQDVNEDSSGTNDIPTHNERNVVISFMSDSFAKICFWGLLILCIITIPYTGSIIPTIFLIIVDIFILRPQFKTKVRGFRVDYDSRTITIPAYFSVTYDSGRDSIKDLINERRNGITFSFDELKSISSDGEREVKTDEKGNVTVNDYNILDIITTFGTIRFKLKHNDTRFNKVAQAISDVIDYENHQ